MKHLLFFTAAALSAQTTIKPDQLRAAPPETPKPVLLAFSAKGFSPVTLGPGITATLTAAGWVIDVAPPSPTVITLARVRTQVTADASGSFPLTAAGALYRNGLLMTAAVDYTLAAGRATPKTPWAADDIVIVEEIELK